MNCRIKSNAKDRCASWTRAALVSLFFLASSPAAFAANAPEQLSVLEQSIVGSKSTDDPIEKRVRQLELKVFAKVQKGSLSARILALEKFAGIFDSGNNDSNSKTAKSKANSSKNAINTSVSSNGMMPPLPPRFDNGQDAVKQAPERSSNAVDKAATEANKNDQTAQKLEEAVKLHHSGKINEAEQSLRIILAKNPHNADAYFSLGAIAESRGDLKSALEYYTSAMQANPNDSEAHDAVAELSRKITASAAQTFINPLEAPPTPASAKILQGRAMELNANAGTSSNNLQGQLPFSAPTIPNANISGRQGIPTLGVTQPNKQSAGSTIARTLARAALGAALSGTGLHCPACHLLRGF